MSQRDSSLTGANIAWSSRRFPCAIETVSVLVFCMAVVISIVLLSSVGCTTYRRPSAGKPCRIHRRLLTASRIPGSLTVKERITRFWMLACVNLGAQWLSEARTSITAVKVVFCRRKIEVQEWTKEPRNHRYARNITSSLAFDI